MTLATTYDQAWLKSYQDASGEYANWNGMDPYNVNPYWDVYKNSNSSKKDQFRFNGKVVWNITQHLKVQGTAGAELNWFTLKTTRLLPRRDMNPVTCRIIISVIACITSSFWPSIITLGEFRL